MQEYKLDVIRCEVKRSDPGDGVLEDLIELEIAVLRNDNEVGRFEQRYGIDIENADLREHILSRVKEIISADYDGVRKLKDETRCAAIAANIEVWSIKLP